MKVKTKHELASEKSEYTTKRIWVSGGEFFVGHQNGGEKGAHQPLDQVNGNWGFWHEGPTKISRAEALAECAAMGVEEVEIPD